MQAFQIITLEQYVIACLQAQGLFKNADEDREAIFGTIAAKRKKQQFFEDKYVRGISSKTIVKSDKIVRYERTPKTRQRYVKRQI